MDQETFRREVEVALSALRDVVQLRAMDLATILLPTMPRSQRGWELSRYLLEAIDRLRPAEGDVDSWPQRRYEILTLRYVNGLSPDEVADRLLVSRRHFYRQLQRALDEFADLLWSEVDEGALALPEPPAGQEESDHLDLLQREAAPLLQSRQSCSLPEVWRGVLAVLSPLLPQRGVALQAALPPTLPEVSLSPEILKQFLLGLLGDLLRAGRGSTITLTAQISSQGLELTIALQCGAQAAALENIAWEEVSARASAKLAVLHGARFELLAATRTGATYRASLPVMGSRTVLVVEDNEQVCLLFRRYLLSGGYQPLVAASGAEAIRLAHTRNVYAVTLDLMMNNEDGWDVLQALRHDPQTAHLPIIVCTVLDHEELALMLGATAFLKKPVLCERLLQALADAHPA